MHSRILGLLLLWVCLGTPAAAAHPIPHHPHHAAARPAHRQAAAPDPSLLSRKQEGKASYYAHSLAGRKMADGTRLDPSSNVAASKTLPLGTRARVKNLQNGKSAMVEIRDRGPYKKGRIIDVTPSTARQLGMWKDGIARVEVEPVGPPPAGMKEARAGRRRSS